MNCGPTASNSDPGSSKASAGLADVERRHQQGQRQRVGGVDEPDRAIELGVVACEPYVASQQGSSGGHGGASVNAR